MPHTSKSRYGTFLGIQIHFAFYTSQFSLSTSNPVTTQSDSDLFHKTILNHRPILDILHFGLRQEDHLASE